MTCAAMVGASDNTQTMRDLAVWMTGYISAHNRLLSDTFDLTPWQTASAQVFLLQQYCTSNPSDSVERAAQELVTFLFARRLKAASTPISQTSGENVVLIYPEVMQQAIDALRSAGHTQLESNEALSQSIKSYQVQTGIEETGLFDQATLSSLLR